MAIQFWRQKERYYRLMGSKCSECGTEFFPPVYRCRKCGSERLVEKEMPKTGKIITHTQLHEPLAGYEGEIPMNLAVVQLRNGARVLGEVVDTPSEEIVSGARARVVIRRVRADGESGQILYGYKFVVI
jgi:uncharacterized OB-fold protein